MTDNILWSDREYTVEPGETVITAGGATIRIAYYSTDGAALITVEGNRHCVTHDERDTKILVKEATA